MKLKIKDGRIRTERIILVKDTHILMEVFWEGSERLACLFGETITSELANYRAIRTYASEETGEYRKETTPVGQFPSNAFGLCDMHGNVWEWCQDHWHDNYNGAPKDGCAWVDNENNSLRVLRGGSWYYVPDNCCSAYRNFDNHLFDIYLIGLRVVCVVAPESLNLHF